MVTCHTAAKEFLRQFWFATYPPPVEAQTLATSTPAQRAMKAAKMVSYLAKTHEKVDALVRAATAEGVDPKRVEIVSLTHILQASVTENITGNETRSRRR
jgi:transcription initiation factor TFIIH subunit 1